MENPPKSQKEAKRATRRLKGILSGLSSLLVLLLTKPAKQQNSLDYLIYQDILDKVEGYKTNQQNIMKVEYGELEYSGIQTLICTEGNPCRYPMITMTNFDTPIAELRTLPHIVIAAGLNGLDKIGPSSVISFIDYLTEHQGRYRSLLNEIVLIFLPLVNPNAYVEGQEGQGIYRVAEDFPYLRKDNLCFSTAGARLINEVFNAHLVAAALFFNVRNDGKYSIGYPWTNQHAGEDIPKVDRNAMISFANAMANYGKSHTEGLADYEISSLSKIAAQSAAGIKDNGRVSDWAFGSSQWPKNVKRCLPKTLAFDPKKQQYQATQLRALSFEVFNPKNEPEPAGQQAAMAFDSVTAENDGNIARSVRLIKAFVTSIKPFAYMLNLTLDKDKKLEVSYKAAGCFSINQTGILWKYSHAERTSDDYWADATYVPLETNYTYFEKRNYSISKALDEIEIKNPITLKVILQCDQKWKKNSTLTPVTNLVRYRVYNNYVIKFDRFTLTSSPNKTVLVNELIPQQVPEYLFDLSDNKVVSFIEKAVPLQLNSTRIKMNGTVVWNEKLNGYTLNFTSPNLTKQSTYQGNVQVRGHYNGNKFFFGKQVQVYKRNDNVWVSKGIVGGIEIVGSYMHLTVQSGQSMGLVAIPNQTQSCLTRTLSCIGLPLTTYGVVEYGKINNDELVLYIEQNQDKFTFTGRVLNSSKHHLTDKEGSVSFKFYGVQIKTQNLSVDGQGNYGFQRVVLLPKSIRDVLGQILILTVYDKNGTAIEVPIGIAKLKTDRLPYNFKSSSKAVTTDLKLHQPEREEGVFIPLALGFSCLAVLMVWMFLLVFLQFRKFDQEEEKNRQLKKQLGIVEKPTKHESQTNLKGDLDDSFGESIDEDSSFGDSVESGSLHNKHPLLDVINEEDGTDSDDNSFTQSETSGESKTAEVL